MSTPKTNKNTKITKSMTNADKMEAITKQTNAELYASIRSTNKYQRILASTEKAIEDAAKAGEYSCLIPTIEVEDELGAPSETLCDLIFKCENPKAIIQAYFDDLKTQGYEIIYDNRNVPMYVSWEKTNKAN